jgi:hypothetical protein
VLSRERTRRRWPSRAVAGEDEEALAVACRRVPELARPWRAGRVQVACRIDVVVACRSRRSRAGRGEEAGQRRGGGPERETGVGGGATGRRRREKAEVGGYVREAEKGGK